MRNIGSRIAFLVFPIQTFFLFFPTYFEFQSMLGKKEKKYQHFNIFDYTYLPKTDICLVFFRFFSMNLSLSSPPRQFVIYHGFKNLVDLLCHNGVAPLHLLQLCLSSLCTGTVSKWVPFSIVPNSSGGLPEIVVDHFTY